MAIRPSVSGGNRDESRHTMKACREDHCIVNVVVSLGRKLCMAIYNLSRSQTVHWIENSCI